VCVCLGVAFTPVSLPTRRISGLHFSPRVCVCGCVCHRPVRGGLRLDITRIGPLGWQRWLLRQVCVCVCVCLGGWARAFAFVFVCVSLYLCAGCDLSQSPHSHTPTHSRIPAAEFESGASRAIQTHRVHLRDKEHLAYFRMFEKAFASSEVCGCVCVGVCVCACVSTCVCVCVHVP
jgi:hypothetical protein